MLKDSLTGAAVVQGGPRLIVGNGALSPTVHKRSRRRQVDIKRLEDALIAFVRQRHPTTPRLLYYVMVSHGLIEKTEASYKNVVLRLLVELRQSGAIPWDHVVDQTRIVFRPQTHDSIQDAMLAAARGYRLSLWRNEPVRVDIWCESLSIAGVIMDTTKAWGVSLFPGKGYSSHSFLWLAAQAIKRRKVPTVIYQFGDYDPSGQDIMRHVRDRLREYSGRDDIQFHTAAVTREQIVEWDLPGHPAKSRDSRQGRYAIKEAVELEAIPPDRLNDLLVSCITRHIDPAALARNALIEEAERQSMFDIIGGGFFQQ